MQTATTAPVEPAAAEPVLPAVDPAATPPTELRIDDAPRLDDAADLDPAPETPPAERKLNRHDQAMVDIVARRRERIEAERAEGRAQGIPDDREPAPDPAAAPAAAPAPPADARAASPAPVDGDPASAAPAAPAAPAGPVRTHKIVVRGNEITMSEDDMRRAAELGVESEARIRHADQVLAEARRIAATGQQQPTPGVGPSPPAAPPPAPAPAPSDADRDAMRELARELLYGDEEKVVDALHRTIQRQPQQPVDPDAVTRDVLSRVDARLGLQRDLQTFGNEYPEVINDPDLATLAANYVQQLRAHYAQTQTPRTELDLFREAGNATRQAVQRWSGNGASPSPDPAPTPPAAQPGARLAIKRNTPQAPAAAAAQPATSAPRQKTGSEIVNEMRRARGQPVYA